MSSMTEVVDKEEQVKIVCTRTIDHQPEVDTKSCKQSEGERSNPTTPLTIFKGPNKVLLVNKKEVQCVTTAREVNANCLFTALGAHGIQ